MKREDVENKIPGITDEQLNWLMQENGADINREKSAATALQTQLTAAQAQLKTAQDGLAAFDGKKKPEEYEAELAKLQADLKAQADGFRQYDLHGGRFFVGLREACPAAAAHPAPQHRGESVHLQQSADGRRPDA